MRGWVGVGCLIAIVGVGQFGCVWYLDPKCDDRIKNGDETDIDCGGPECGGICQIGDSCGATADCEESNCEGGTCVPLPCDNGVLDGDETDIDCGGPECRKCPGGRSCEVADDCFNEDCQADSNTCFALDVTFADAVAYDSGEKTYAIFSGDLNGDGQVDLAAANEQANSISVFLNDAGNFSRVDPVFETGVYPTGGNIADMNNDGNLDVVTADYRGDSVSVLLGAGDGTLAQPAASYETREQGETSNLAIGDLDGDGNMDVVASNPQDASLSQFMGSPDGTLGPEINIPVGFNPLAQPFSVALGDFDGDGDNDLATPDMTSGTVFVRLGNGDGTFGDQAGYEEGGTPAFIIVAHDMNLDGNLDLAIANRGSNDVSVLIGRGDGSFRKPLVSSTIDPDPDGDPDPDDRNGIGPYSIAVADFNQDTVPDLATVNFMSSDGTVLLGIGNGLFEDAIYAGQMGEGSYGVAVGDFNGDGKPDFASANAVSWDVTVKLSTAD